MDSILALFEVPFFDIDFGLDSPPPPPPRLPWPNPPIINTISVTSHAKFSREYHVRTCCEIKIWSIEESENQQDKHLLSSILLFSVFVSDLDNHHSPSGVIQIVRSSKGGGGRSEKANTNEQFSIWRGDTHQKQRSYYLNYRKFVSHSPKIPKEGEAWAKTNVHRERGCNQNERWWI